LDDVPTIEALIGAKIFKRHRVKSMPIAIGINPSNTDCLTMLLSDLRRSLDQDDDLDFTFMGRGAFFRQSFSHNQIFR